MKILDSMKHSAIFCLASVFLALAACSKDDSTTEKGYLDGYLSLGSVPPYVRGNEVITFTPKGVYHPEGKALGMYFTISSIHSSADTLWYAEPGEGQRGPLPADYSGVSHSFCIDTYKTDTLGTFTVSYVVYPSDNDNYYVTSSSASVTTVHDTLTIPEIAETFHNITDRDGYKYDYTEFGGIQWLNRNLATVHDASSTKIGMPYKESEAVSYILGRFYTYAEALKACPDGWRLPTNAEWDIITDAVSSGTNNIGDYLIDATFNGNKMWEFWPKVKITGSMRLNLLPAGYANVSSRRFDGSPDYAAFWTSDTHSDGRPIYKYIYSQENSLKTGYADPASMAMPVRCVRKAL